MTFESSDDRANPPPDPNVYGLYKRRAIRSVVNVNAQQTLAFRDLLAAWNRREDARNQNNFRALAAARVDLEDARAKMHFTTLSR